MRSLIDIAAIERILKANPTVTHVFAAHCESTSGIREYSIILSNLAQC
jgi:aspartate aminotransferase-like enzyme